MKCVDDCHGYEINTVLDEHEKYLLRFYEMRSDGTKINGTTNEEVLAALIHRLTKLNEKLYCNYNHFAIQHLRQALMLLEMRTIDRRKREVEGTFEK